MLWYVATVYTKHPGGFDAAFVDAAKAAADLIRQGMVVYSPIVHSHPLAVHGGLDPTHGPDLAKSPWLALDAHMMARCDGLAVVMMPNWQESHGIAVEIDTFTRAGKPVRYIEWPITEAACASPG